MNMVIYYPYAPSAEWLRLASLCWDSICLIGPIRILPPELLELDDILGSTLYTIDGEFLKREHPELKAQVRDWLMKRAEQHGIQISELSDSNHYDPDYIALDYVNQLIDSPMKSQQAFMRQEARGITAYLTGLYAYTAAQRGSMDLITLEEGYTDIIFHQERALVSQVTTAVLEAYIPEKLFSMDPRQIAEFREEFAVKRLKYEAAIQSLIKEFKDVASEGQLLQLKERIIDIAKERVDETRQTYQRAKLEMIAKTFGVALTPPAFVTTLASALGIGIFAPAGIAAAISILLATKLIEWDKAKIDKEKNSWSYLLDVAKIGS